MRTIYKNFIVALAIVTMLSTSAVSRKAQANPALAVAMGVSLVLAAFGVVTYHQTDIPISYEENLSKNLRAMESSCQRSSDLEQINLYTKFWDFNRNKFYPRFKAQVEKTQNPAGLEIVSRLEKLKETDQNSFDWNVANLALATSNIAVERARQKQSWYNQSYYTSFVYLKTWSRDSRVKNLDEGKCGLQNVIAESNRDLVVMTQPANMDDSVRLSATPMLRQMMAPELARLEAAGQL